MRSILIPDFVSNPQEYFEELREQLDWIRHDSVPRSEYYCDSKNRPYTYGKGAGIRTYYPGPRCKGLVELWASVDRRVGVEFDVCFLNRYDDSRDHLGWHSDDSPEMDDQRPIAIVSLGAEREIWFRKRPELVASAGGGEITHKLLLPSGSLCLMPAGFQDVYQHRIPKVGFECGPRISLTFRGRVD